MDKGSQTLRTTAAGHSQYIRQVKAGSYGDAGYAEKLVARPKFQSFYCLKWKAPPSLEFRTKIPAK
jgi:hypothetical protein